MKRFNYIGLLFLMLVFGCKSTKNNVRVKDDGKLTFKFIQLNDVYEIAPLSGGKYGGMARVAHVADSIRKVEPNTYMFMAGDFLNPSLLGGLKVDGERIRGRQMIEVMNAMNFELATFGNHEFDLDEADLQKRMDESNFYWTSANVFQNNEDGPRSFFFRRNNDTIYVPETYTISMMDADSTKIDVGLFSVTIGSNPIEYVHYADIFLEASSAYSMLQSQQTDVIIGLTHLKVSQDIELANKFPEIQLIMGGHEHTSMLVPTQNGIVAKADANAKSIYVHTITYDKNTGKSKIDSYLMPIDERTPSSPMVKAIVDKWNVVLEQKLKDIVDNPNDIVYTSEVPIDGTDSANRAIQTNLGELVTEAMFNSFNTPVDGALVNGGSFRLDDMLTGEITSLDIVRVLPFGGKVLKVEMTGALLKKVLDFGQSQQGTGAYLQRYNFKQDEQGDWMIAASTINRDQVYSIAVSDFLMKGYDIPFLKPDHSGVVSVYKPSASEGASDIRKAVIRFLKEISKN